MMDTKGGVQLSTKILTRREAGTGWQYSFAAKRRSDSVSEDSATAEDEPVALGTEGLLDLALALSDRGFRVADVDLRDAAWRSSDEHAPLSSIADAMRTALRSKDSRWLADFTSRIGRPLLLHTIVLSDTGSGRRIRVSRLGDVDVIAPDDESRQVLAKSFLDSLNARAA